MDGTVTLVLTVVVATAFKKAYDALRDVTSGQWWDALGIVLGWVLGFALLTLFSQANRFGDWVPVVSLGAIKSWDWQTLFIVGASAESFIAVVAHDLPARRTGASLFGPARSRSRGGQLTSADVTAVDGVG